MKTADLLNLAPYRLYSSEVRPSTLTAQGTSSYPVVLLVMLAWLSLFSLLYLLCLDAYASIGSSASPKLSPSVPTTTSTKEEVYEWAKQLFEKKGMDHEDAKILLQQKVNGETLFNLTEAKLREDGMPRGPASTLISAIEELKASQHLQELLKNLSKRLLTHYLSHSCFSSIYPPTHR
jgi:hypothetical protein